MPQINGPRPLFDTGKTPKDPAQAGAQPAADVWGIGKKTVDRLREKLRLDPTATPTVADFAYVDLDAFDVAPNQKALLVDQQSNLVNGLHVQPEAAAPALTADLLASMNREIEDAIGAIEKGEPTKRFVHRRVVDHALHSAMSYGMYGGVTLPTQDELAKAYAQGMKMPEGGVALTVRRAFPGEDDPGAAVVAFRPRDLLAPVLVQMGDGTTQHSFTTARDVKPARAFIIEEPKETFSKLKGFESLARDAAADVWIDADPAGRRARLDAFGARIETFAKAIDDANLGAHHASWLFGALSAMRSIHAISEKHIDG